MRQTAEGKEQEIIIIIIMILKCKDQDQEEEMMPIEQSEEMISREITEDIEIIVIEIIKEEIEGDIISN